MSVARQAIARRRRAKIDPRYQGQRGRDAVRQKEKETAKVMREQIRRMRAKRK